jgi:hypothetical protein
MEKQASCFGVADFGGFRERRLKIISVRSISEEHNLLNWVVHREVHVAVAEWGVACRQRMQVLMSG